MAKETPTNKPPVKQDKRKKGFKKFFREVVSELKKVSWPSRKELTNYTVVVIVLILIFAVAIGIVDLGLSKLLDLIT